MKLMHLLIGGVEKTCNGSEVMHHMSCFVYFVKL